MDNPLIRVQGLGKCYVLGQHSPASSYVRFSDTLVDRAKTILRWLKRSNSKPQKTHSDPEKFWALRDVSFDVHPGEVLGIIGRNGAGKSTLLKILSRVTEPSEGRVALKDRVASLLEVGTGFHPELTGRENIFLNGTILGMRRSEILSKFDEIVAFAEIEKFLDTPVKRYSSGMYVRLAFSVAAHLEPEILIVDEVLAVGDAQFQKKCLGKLSEEAHEGRAVIFVSHNLPAVENLCTRAILLENGRILEDSRDVRGVISNYLSAGPDGTGLSEWVNADNRLNHHAMQPTYFAVVDQTDTALSRAARNDEQLCVIIRADVHTKDPALHIGFALYAQDGEMLLWSLSTDAPEEQWPRPSTGKVEWRCRLPKRFLNEGAYRLELIASLHHREGIVLPGQNSPSVRFEIQGGLSDSPYWVAAREGRLAPVWNWTLADQKP